jgi:hypothetical protein
VTLFNCILDCQSGQEPNDAGAFDASDIDGGVIPCVDQCKTNAGATAGTEFQAFFDGIKAACQSQCFQ